MILARRVTSYKICIYDISTVYSTFFIIFFFVCRMSSFFLSCLFFYSFAILFLCFFFFFIISLFLYFFLAIFPFNSLTSLPLRSTLSSLVHRCFNITVLSLPSICACRHLSFFSFLSLSVSRCVLSAVRRNLRYRYSHQMKAIIFGYKSRHHHPQTSFKDTLKKISVKKPFYQRFLHYKNIK